MARIDPEKIPADQWEAVTPEKLKEMHEQYLQRKANRNKPKTFYNGYGMIVSTRKK